MLVVIFGFNCSIILQFSSMRRSALLRPALLMGVLLAFGSGGTGTWLTDSCAFHSGVASRVVSIASNSLAEISCGPRKT